MDKIKVIKKESLKKRSYAPQTLLRAMDILSCFTFERPELTSAEIAGMLRIAPSTLYRFLAALEQEEYIARVENTNRYAVGLRVVAMSSVALCRSNIRLHGEPILKSLLGALNMSANLGVAYKGSVLHVAFAMVNEVDKLYSIVGRCSGLTCTAMGKVLLSAMSRADMHSVINKYGFTPSTPNSIMNMERLENELDIIRTNGYSMDREEKSLGRYCLAMPVYQQGGKMVAAMSISTSEIARLNNDFDNIHQVLSDHAASLSARLGYYNN